MTLKERFLELQNEYIQAFAEKQEVDIEFNEKKMKSKFSIFTKLQ